MTVLSAIFPSRYLLIYVFVDLCVELLPTSLLGFHHRQTGFDQIKQSIE